MGRSHKTILELIYSHVFVSQTIYKPKKYLFYCYEMI
jgi:hypothetical protein